MWPPKQYLLALPDHEEGEWIIEVLKGLGIKAEPYYFSKEKSNSSRSSPWDDWTLKCTDVIVWPGYENHFKAEDKAFSGLVFDDFSLLPLDEFLHTLFNSLILIPFSPVTANSASGKPLIFHILEKAGFEPSLFWQNEKRQWCFEKGRGIHLVVPDWLKVEGKNLFGYGRKRSFNYCKPTWVVNSDRIDFYLDSPHKYIGFIPRCTAMNEEELCETFANALSLGVPWSILCDVLFKYALGQKFVLKKAVEFEENWLLGKDVADNIAV